MFLNEIEYIELLYTSMHALEEHTKPSLFLESDTMTDAHSTPATLWFSCATLRNSMDPVHVVEVYWQRGAVYLPGLDGMWSPAWDWEGTGHNTTASIQLPLKLHSDRLHLQQEVG